jgi:hypothetical protein
MNQSDNGAGKRTKKNQRSTSDLLDVNYSASIDNTQNKALILDDRWINLNDVQAASDYHKHKRVHPKHEYEEVAI